MYSILLCLAIGLTSPDQVSAALDRAHTEPEFKKQAETAEAALKVNPSAPGMRTQLARAYYLEADAEKDKTARLTNFEKAAASAEAALKSDPNDIRATYWHALSYLQQADIKGGFSGLKLVKQAMRELDTVIKKEPAYDSAGGYRSLGKVLIEAPEWAFIGDKKRGLELIKKAVDISPKFIVNRLYLAQALAANGKTAEARKEAAAVIAFPPSDDPKEDSETKDEARTLLAKLK